MIIWHLTLKALLLVSHFKPPVCLCLEGLHLRVFMCAFFSPACVTNSTCANVDNLSVCMYMPQPTCMYGALLIYACMCVGVCVCHCSRHLLLPPTYKYTHTAM